VTQWGTATPTHAPVGRTLTADRVKPRPAAAVAAPRLPDAPADAG